MRKETTFFNTINLEDDSLKEAIENCNNQEKNVLSLMKDNEGYTPCEVHDLYTQRHDNSVPITSIRRAMTCLTKKGLLAKSTEKREGRFGKPNYIWQRNYVTKHN